MNYSKITFTFLVVIGSFSTKANQNTDSLSYWYQRLMSYHSQAKMADAGHTLDSAIRTITGQAYHATHGKIYNLGGAMYQAQGQPKQSLMMHEKALVIFDSLGLEGGMADTYEYIGKLKWRIGLNQEALLFFQKSLTLNKKLNRHYPIQNNHYWIANVYLQFDQLDLALKHYIAATEFIEMYDDHEHINSARLYRGLARVYVEAAYLDEAKKYIDKSMHLSKHYNNQTALAADYSILGSIYYARRNLDSAIYYHKKCLAVYKTKHQLEWIAQSSMNLSRVYYAKNQSDSTNKYLDIALHTYQKTHNQSGIAHALLMQGHIRNKIGNYREAVQAFKSSLATFKDNSRPSIVQSNFRGLAEAYGQLQMIDSAYHYLGEFHDNLDVSSAKKEDRNLALFTEQVNMAQKNRELAFQALEKERLEASIFRRNTYLISICAAFACLFIFSYSYFKRYQLKQKNKQLLLKQDHQKNTLALKNAQLRTKIYSNISHEFKTPLMLILSPIEQLLKVSSAENRVTLKILQRNAQQLKLMVDQLLDMNSAKKGLLTLNCESVDIGSEVRSMVKEFNPIFDDASLNVSVQIPNNFIEVNIDKDKFEKVFNNILSNAIKHTPEGGQIAINLNYHNTNLGQLEVILDIFNTGKIIPENELERIFDLYHQVDPETDKGNGIGLSLTKEFVELHGGQVTVSSNAKGTTFRVAIPSQKPVDKPQKIESNLLDTVEKTSEVLENENPKIVVVDDNEDILEILHQSLTTEGYNVAVCNHSLKAEKMISNISPALVITDLVMPEMNGYELVRDIKTNIEISHIPILMLTAKTDLKHKIAGLDNGADMYLEKPFDQQELLVRIKNLIRQRQQLLAKYRHPSHDIKELYKDQGQLDQKFLNQVTDLIIANMTNNDFDIQKLASEMAMSQSTLFKKIKGTTNLSISQFIRYIRLQEAIKLMELSTYSLSETASMTGFNSLNFFTKCFKQQFEMTPTEYKMKKLRPVAS